MRILTLLLIFASVAAVGQEKIFLYPASQKVTFDGFDKDSIPPFIEHFRAHPDSANGSAILICPGGAYTHLAVKHEGTDVAKFYNQYGFDAFVLRYRLNSFDQTGHRFPDQYEDVTNALRVIKSRAKE